MKEPTKFRNQREAYWYRKGLCDAQDCVFDTLDMEIERYNLEWLDHLPED